MTLSFPNRTRSYDETRRRISFVGHDGMFEVPFFIQTDALSATARGEAQYLAAFDAARASICARVVLPEASTGRFEAISVPFTVTIHTGKVSVA